MALSLRAPVRSVSSEDRIRARIAHAREILASESSAIAEVASRIDESFSEAVDRIVGMSTAGRLVVAGIGKSGFIGMKLSATFASVGVPSFFLHPTEAMHGDLGRVTRDDVVVILSNSGASPEISAILPSLKKLGCVLVGITARSDSSLGRACTVTIALGKIPEAGPLGLAPTSSTAAILAVGDALAMTVLQARPIPRDQFAGLHPGGALGKSLRLVGEVMRSGDSHCIVRENTSCRDVIHQITRTKGRPGAASVVAANGKLVGIFTDGDLRRCLHNNINFLTEPVHTVMGRAPKTVQSEVFAEEALALMSDHRIDQLVVVDQEMKPVGMVDIQDLVG